MNKKEEREFIKNKYGGRCAYCGCILPEKWHVDHLKPIIRDLENKNKCEFPEFDTLENKMPSCPSCNILKNSMGIDSFRNVIKGFIKSLNRDSTQYKVAKRYGLITETNKGVRFHYEK